MNSLLQERTKYPWLYPTFIYKLTSSGKEFYRNLNIVQNFTIDVINKNIARRKAQKLNEGQGNTEDVEEGGETRMKRQRVFLDTLLDQFDAGEIDVQGKMLFIYNA